MLQGLDLGLAERVAFVSGASAGLGRACAEALGRCGAKLILCARTEPSLRAAATALSHETGADITTIVADVTTEEGRKTIFDADLAPDIIVTNAAGPPMGDFRDFDEAIWHDAVRVSMISPIMMIQGFIDGMIERKWGRIINITSSAVKAPLPLLGLSNGARSGLTGFVAGLAREVAIHGVTINNLLPGRIETDRLRSYVTRIAESHGIDRDVAAMRLTAANPMRRFGHPSEFGAFCAFLASEQAAYVTGQNIVIDGGEYVGP